jgi:hypothetical protein
MSLGVYALALDSRGYLAASTSSGFFRSLRSTTSIERKSDLLPVAFHLEQNYPNPFNPSTTIKFELPKASQVTLTVYDILGREVSVLVNEKKDAGVHEVKFNAAGLASGIYFYKLQAGSDVDTKKSLLIR